ncbi:MAG: hypothetical protein PWR07_1122 [Bacillota bacterium]|nr:hypothetical protein [Bacillota bacterium]
MEELELGEMVTRHDEKIKSLINWQKDQNGHLGKLDEKMDIVRNKLDELKDYVNEKVEQMQRNVNGSLNKVLLALLGFTLSTIGALIVVIVKM